MSYILDALRRAEAERERGAVPGLHSQASALAPQAAGSGRQGAAWTTPLLLALTLVLAALLVWQLFGGDSASAVRSAAPTDPPASTAASVAARPPLPLEPTPTVPTPPSPPQVQRVPVSGPARTTTAETAQRKPPPAPARRPPPAAEPRRSEPRPKSALSDAPARGSAETLQPQAAAAATATATAAASAPVLPLARLPEPWHGVVARLAFGGVVYSANAAQRFVIVDGQIVHEGDSVAPDVQLERIEPHSAVLRAGPHRTEVRF